jgi:hypothetical protein
MLTIKSISRVALFSVLSFSAANVANAGQVKLDQFKVMKNGIVLFEDNFSDGFAPPSSEGLTPSGTCYPGGSAISGTAPPNCPNTYQISTIGGFGPEAGGKLTIDTSLGFQPSGADFIQRAILRGNTLPLSQSNLGIKSDDVVIVNGLFDLGVSGLSGDETYGIRLTDRIVTTTRDGEFVNDVVRVGVKHYANGDVGVRFRKTEFTPLLINLFDEEIMLSATQLAASQILLTLETDPDGTGAKNVVGASFTIDGITTPFGGTTTIYNGLDDYSRAAFFTVLAEPSNQVSEPATLALFAFGLAGLGFARRRRIA